MRWLLFAAIALVSGQVQCPDGYTAPATYTGYCYKYSPATLTWNGHEAVCSGATLNGQPYAGGHLATIFNQPSATAVMNNYCNGLSQLHGQMNYFIGYYCISSSYTSRPDWRWTSGLPTTWLHSSPTYLSGAEPDDFGCGMAHFSDDGANTGRVGDWSCTRARAGGCCEAPVIPTPSATMTPSNTATATTTRTATRTQTATNTRTTTRTATSTQTGTQTAAATQTRTASRTATKTTTQTATATATSTATSTATPTSSQTISTSPSSTVSPSVSSSPSTSSSLSPSTTTTTSPTISTSITPTPRPISVLAVGESGSAGQESLGVGAGPDTAAQEAADQQKFVVSVAAGAAALIFALCCGWLLCALQRRRQMREKKARAALASKQQSRPKAQTATVAATLGMKTPTKPNALFRSMNPALLTGPITRGPRLSMALSAYKSPTSFRPQPVAGQHRQSTVAESLLENPESDEVEDAVIGIEEQPEDTGAAKEYNQDNMEEIEEQIENEQEEEQDDYVDDEEDIATALARKITGKHVDFERASQQRTKKATESATAPPVESKKLVIGKGALLQEHVQRQTVQLRRVSKVRGDQQLTALRQQRPSTRAGYAPQSSLRNLLNPYEFTATVSRVIVKTDM
jgi:hypothetical protein